MILGPAITELAALTRAASATALCSDVMVQDGVGFVEHLHGAGFSLGGCRSVAR